MSGTDDEVESSGGDGGPILGVVRTITPDFIRRSYALKFGIVLILLGLAVGAVGVVGSQQLEGEFQEEVNQQFETLSQSEANSLRDWNTENRRTTRMYARQPVVQSGEIFTGNQSAPDIAQYFQNERSGNEWGSGANSPNLHLINKDNGNVYASTKFGLNNIADIHPGLAEAAGNLGPGSSVERVNAYNSTEDGQVEIGYITNVNRDANIALVHTVPVSDLSGSFATGIFEGNSQGVAMLVDGEGRILFEQTNTNSQFLKQYPDTEVLSNAEDLNEDATGSDVSGPGEGPLSAVDSYGLAGRDYVVGYSKVSGSPAVSGGSASGGDNPDWTVLIHINTGDAYGEVQSVADQALLRSGIGVLLIGLFGAVLGRNTAKAIDRLTDKAEEMEAGNLEVDLDSGRIDNIGRLYDGFDNMRTALKQQIQEAESARKEAEVSRAEAMEMSNYLQETADEYAEIMQQCAAGDLTERMDPDGENEAMDRIANEFNEMIDELEKTTGQLKSFSDEVETAGNVVKNSSESVRDASEQVADSVQKISDDAYDQKESLQEISETMDEIATDLEAFAAEHDIDFGDSLDRIEEIANMLNDVVDLAEETMAESENVAGAAEEQAAELNEVTQRAEDLSRYARPLREVLDRFETESEHEFYFPTGPGSGDSTMPGGDGD